MNALIVMQTEWCTDKSRRLLPYVLCTSVGWLFADSKRIFTFYGIVLCVVRSFFLSLANGVSLIHSTCPCCMTKDLSVNAYDSLSFSVCISFFFFVNFKMCTAHVFLLSFDNHNITHKMSGIKTKNPHINTLSACISFEWCAASCSVFWELTVTKHKIWDHCTYFVEWGIHTCYVLCYSFSILLFRWCLGLWFQINMKHFFVSVCGEKKASVSLTQRGNGQCSKH